MAQQAGQSPPQAPPIPPEVQQAFKSPSWEDVVNVLRDRVIFNYKVDIETNSTIDAEAAQDKQDIAELLNAVSQFLNGVAPLVQEGVLPIEVAKSMLLVVSRRFNFGSQLEDALNAMQAPQPKPDPAAEAKAAAEGAKAKTAQMQAKNDQIKLQQEMKFSEQEFEQKQQLMILEHNVKMADAEAKAEASRLQAQNLSQKAQQQALQHEMKMEALKAAKDQAKEMA
jgi:hypothetical protein